MKRYLLTALAALALGATPASAQVMLYALGGPVIPVGDDLEDVESGIQFAGGVILDVTERVWAYGEGQLGTNHDVDGSDVTVQPSALMAGLGVGLTGGEGSTFGTYVFGGLGLQTVSIDDDSSDPSDGTLGYQLGAGISYQLFGLPSTVQGVYQAANFDADSDIGEIDFATFTIRFGFGLPLGGDN